MGLSTEKFSHDQLPAKLVEQLVYAKHHKFALRKPRPRCLLTSAAKSHQMITTLISLLIAGLVLYVIYFVVGMFIKGQLLNIIGIILGLVFLLYALRMFNVVAI